MSGSVFLLGYNWYLVVARWSVLLAAPASVLLAAGRPAGSAAAAVLTGVLQEEVNNNRKYYGRVGDKKWGWVGGEHTLILC